MTADAAAVRRRPKDRKQQILVQARDLFLGLGYPNVSMAMIADRVGITAGALYRHYSTKADLLEAVVRDAFRTLTPPAEGLALDELIDREIAAVAGRSHLADLWSREVRYLPEQVRREIRAVMRETARAYLAPLQASLARAEPGPGRDDRVVGPVGAELPRPRLGAAALGRWPGAGARRGPGAARRVPGRSGRAAPGGGTGAGLHPRAPADRGPAPVRHGRVSGDLDGQHRGRGRGHRAEPLLLLRQQGRTAAGGTRPRHPRALAGARRGPGDGGGPCLRAAVGGGGRTCAFRATGPGCGWTWSASQDWPRSSGALSGSTWPSGWPCCARSGRNSAWPQARALVQITLTTASDLPRIWHLAQQPSFNAWLTSIAAAILASTPEG